MAKIGSAASRSSLPRSGTSQIHVGPLGLEDLSKACAGYLGIVGPIQLRWKSLLAREIVVGVRFREFVCGRNDLLLTVIP